MMEQNIQIFEPSHLVVEAVENASLVVHYIAEMGLDFNTKDVETITLAKVALQNNQWSQEIENNFWVSYRNLTAIIKPVDIDSLVAMKDIIVQKPNFWDRLFNRKIRANIAYQTVRFYTAFALITMLIMLLLHMYFSIGSVRLSRIQAINNKLITTNQQLTEIMSISDRTNQQALKRQDQLMNELAQYDTEKRSNIELLAKWVNVMKNYMIFENTKSVQTKIQNAYSTDIIALPSTPDEELKYNIEVIQQAQNYIFLLGLYILPLFYGLLGALTYVLRDLNNKIQNRQYRKDNNIAHVLRLILGIIAGLAVGVFWGDISQQDSFSVVSSLGPLLVAFLAGLTVEYVFSAIEKFVKSFLDRSSTIKS